MSQILKQIKASKKSLGILVDPEKTVGSEVYAFAKAIQSSITRIKKALDLDYVILLVGGSTMNDVDMDNWVKKLKDSCDLPIVLFPGSSDQISEHADGILFLSLLSGRNPDYLVEQQVKAARRLRKSVIEVMPTTYLLINGGKKSAVERVTQTKPMNQDNVNLIAETAYAGQLMGHQLLYLEAGSGALNPVSSEIIKQCSEILNIPIIVGGGLRTFEDIEAAYHAGASMVVVGTAIEENLDWKG
jgi:putative glycerol-1-phosphate prenyltransferase